LLLDANTPEPNGLQVLQVARPNAEMPILIPLGSRSRTRQDRSPRRGADD
jgi:hypothetical protein